MFDKIKHWFGNSAPAMPEPIPQPPESRPAPPKKKEPPKAPKDIATEAGEPYVAIVSMDIDSNNLHQGAFELDWNDIFVARLVKAGYMLKATDTDADMVDRWFQNVCRHVVMETWEQEQAIKTGFIKERNLGDGRSEVS